MPRRLAGAALAIGIALALAGGLAGGLVRGGAVVDAGAAAWGHAALAHAALMIGAFFGSVIGVERAVAARSRLAWSAPAMSAGAGIAFLAGEGAAAAGLLVAASGAFVAVNAVLLRRQRAAHTALLLASAIAWFAGNALFAGGIGSGAVLPAWFTFLVATIAAERLEMTRLMRRRRGARASLFAVLAAVGAGAALAAAWPRAGSALWGAGLVMLAAWLLAFDVARRTIRAPGLPRYMAVCLMTGYAWLAVGGAAWAATALGAPLRDAALHAIGLGFVFGMVMGHAPVILPAVARVKVAFGPAFYAPVVLLQASLAWRLAAAGLDARALTHGAAANAAAVALFALTIAASALAWRRLNAAPRARA